MRFLSMLVSTITSCELWLVLCAYFGIMFAFYFALPINDPLTDGKVLGVCEVVEVTHSHTILRNSIGMRVYIPYHSVVCEVGDRWTVDAQPGRYILKDKYINGKVVNPY